MCKRSHTSRSFNCRFCLIGASAPGNNHRIANRTHTGKGGPLPARSAPASVRHGQDNRVIFGCRLFDPVALSREPHAFKAHLCQVARRNTVVANKANVGWVNSDTGEPQKRVAQKSEEEEGRLRFVFKVPPREHRNAGASAVCGEEKSTKPHHSKKGSLCSSHQQRGAMIQ